MKYLTLVTALLICSVSTADPLIDPEPSDVIDAWSEAVAASHAAESSRMECEEAKEEAQYAFSYALELGATASQLQDGSDFFDTADITADTAQTFLDAGHAAMDTAYNQWDIGNEYWQAGGESVAQIHYCAAVGYYRSAVTLFLGDHTH